MDKERENALLDRELDFLIESLEIMHKYPELAKKHYRVDISVVKDEIEKGIIELLKEKQKK